MTKCDVILCYWKNSPTPSRPMGECLPNATERQRWDAMWRAVDAGSFDVGEFYKAGMNDDHIDTALRRVATA
jgi:hypothetical protein